MIGGWGKCGEGVAEDWEGVREWWVMWWRVGSVWGEVVGDGVSRMWGGCRGESRKWFGGCGVGVWEEVLQEPESSLSCMYGLENADEGGEGVGVGVAEG